MAKHPLQVPIEWQRSGLRRSVPMVDSAITLRAYEVYKHVYAPQEALVTGHCRGGFGVIELIAFLYAYGFPLSEWRQRTNEAFEAFGPNAGTESRMT